MAKLDEVAWIPKRRYLIMRDYLAGTGDLAHWMMKMTASLQVSVDYKDESDAAVKLSVIARLAPILTAISASSPLSQGQSNGFQSFRSHIWSHTDPARCGLPKCYFKKDFSFRDYADYALDVPMFFIERKGVSLPATGRTFRKFLDEGLNGHTASLADWKRHLTFLFPEVRLKQYIEIRSCDRQPGQLSFAVAVLIKALIYSPQTLAEASAWLKPLTYLQCKSGLEEAARHGRQGRMDKKLLGDWMVEAVRLGRVGLDRLLAAGRSSELEGKVYSSLERLVLREKKTVADSMLLAASRGDSALNLIRL
jgi:glutamate--cysteine ligase